MRRRRRTSQAARCVYGIKHGSWRLLPPVVQNCHVCRISMTEKSDEMRHEHSDDLRFHTKVAWVGFVSHTDTFAWCTWQTRSGLHKNSAQCLNFPSLWVNDGNRLLTKIECLGTLFSTASGFSNEHPAPILMMSKNTILSNNTEIQFWHLWTHLTPERL